MYRTLLVLVTLIGLVVAGQYIVTQFECTLSGHLNRVIAVNP
jgi:hypothetical protein